MKKSYSQFVKETSQMPLLTKEEETLLLKKASVGDKEALESLIKANLRFVVRIANLFKNKGVPLNNLIKEGRLGLIEAIESYDSAKNVKFISYAVWHARNRIIKLANLVKKTSQKPLPTKEKEICTSCAGYWRGSKC